MGITFKAIYAAGVFHPTQPLQLPEGTPVELTIARANEEFTHPSESEIVKRIEACHSYAEWLNVMNALPVDDGGYDIVKALDENRRWSGERPLVSDRDAQP